LGDSSIPNFEYSGIEVLAADSTEFIPGFSLNYLFGSNADFGIDELDADLGVPIVNSQDDAVRGVYYNAGNYRTIASSTFLGAMADGDNGNTKTEVMAQYLALLTGEISPNIVATPSELDFQITFPENLYTLELEISNSGLDTLMINNITVEGDGFVYNDLTEIELSHLEQQIIEISFEIGETGLYPGDLTISSNDPDTPELTVQLSADCVIPPIIELDLLAVNVEITINQILEEIITISNIGGHVLNCEMVIIDSSQSTGWLDIYQDSLSILPGSFAELQLTIDPEGLENGVYTAEIVISHDDPEQDDLIIPVTMTLNYTGVDDMIVTTNRLIGNYPNPFNPSTTILFELNTEFTGNTELLIYNLKGQKIKQYSIINSQSSIVWDGTDHSDKPVSSGIYFYKLKSGNYEQTKRMILMK